MHEQTKYGYYSREKKTIFIVFKSSKKGILINLVNVTYAFYLYPIRVSGFAFLANLTKTSQFYNDFLLFLGFVVDCASSMLQGKLEFRKSSSN